MFDEHIAQPNPYLEALKDHWGAALRGFAVILLLCAAGAYLTRQYSASAVLALNPRALHERDANGGRQSPAEVAWNALSDQQIAAILSQFQLDHGMAHLRAHGQIFTYVRSQIAVNVLPAPAGSARQVEVSYTGESPASAMGVANAIAQQMSRAKAPAAPPATASIAAPNSELEKSRRRLKALSQTPLSDTAALRAQVEQRLIKDADLRAARDDAAAKLGALASESAQMNAAARPVPAPPPDPARVALEEQIKTARNRLAGLRQRYTELYPDVQQAEATLAGLEARLRRMPQRPQPVSTPAPHAAALAAVTAQENELRALIAGLDDQIASNQNAAEALRQQIASGKALAQEYATAQQRYSTLLEVQEALDEGDSGGNNASSSPQTPLFMIVKAATSADPIGVAFLPLFWLLSLAGALLAAAFSVYLAEQFAPAVHEPFPARSFHPS